MQVQAIVISLPDANRRREHIKSQFQKLDIPFEFFDAINKQQANTVCQQFNIHEAGKITKGELGCFMSHISIWQKMIDSNIPYSVIFEDDVVLSANIVKILNSLDEIMTKCSIVKLETMFFPIVVGNKEICIDNYCLKPLKSEHMGMAGYVIDLESAKRIIYSLQCDGIVKPIDHYLFKEDLSVRDDIYQVIPALVIQDDVLNKDSTNLCSQLESERRDRRKKDKPKLTSSQKVYRELKRVVNHLSPYTWFYQIKKWQKSRKMIIVEFEKDL